MSVAGTIRRKVSRAPGGSRLAAKTRLTRDYFQARLPGTGSPRKRAATSEMLMRSCPAQLISVSVPTLFPFSRFSLASCLRNILLVSPLSSLFLSFHSRCTHAESNIITVRDRMQDSGEYSAEGKKKKKKKDEERPRHFAQNEIPIPRCRQFATAVG